MYEVLNNLTKVVVGRYTKARAAHSCANRKDLAYGACIHSVSFKE